MLLHYDFEKMQSLLESFYTLTQLRIVVFDIGFKKIAEYPASDCSFCSLIRQNSLAEKKCWQSDQFACDQCQMTGRLYSYTCHAGMTETAAPIRCGSVVIGYLMFGQVLLHANKNAYWSTVRQLCQPYQIDTKALRAAYMQKKPVQPAQVHAATQLLEACAGYLWLQRYISFQENTLLRQLDDYLSANLHADLSVGALCRQFDVSRTKLYRLVREYYGKGVEQLIRGLRVERAKALLTETDLPVSEVAAQVGFDDYNYFIKVFREETGTTPARYRKALLMKTNNPEQTGSD